MEVANQTSWNRSQFSFQDERNHHPEASQPWAGMHTKLIIGMKVKVILPFLVMAFPPPPRNIFCIFLILPPEKVVSLFNLIIGIQDFMH